MWSLGLWILAADAFLVFPSLEGLVGIYKGREFLAIVQRSHAPVEGMRGRRPHRIGHNGSETRSHRHPSSSVINARAITSSCRTVQEELHIVSGRFPHRQTDTKRPGIAPGWRLPRTDRVHIQIPQLRPSMGTTTAHQHHRLRVPWTSGAWKRCVPGGKTRRTGRR